MSFYVFTVVGLAAGILHLVVPGERRVGPVAAFALGVAGAWGGALLAAAFVRGGWASFPPVALGGAVVGAIGAIVAMEVSAEHHRRRRRGAET